MVTNYFIAMKYMSNIVLLDSELLLYNLKL